MQPSRIHHVGLPVLTEAINLYRSRDEVAAFNDELYADHWFENRLDS